MKKIIPCLALFAAGCTPQYIQQPLETTQSMNNTDYQVSYLFEHGGCKVYRFYDRSYGNAVYFTNCSGEVTALGDSTVVRSSSYFNNKPLNISTYIRTKDSGYYQIKTQPGEQRSNKETR